MKIKGLLQTLKGLITPKIYPPSDGTSALQITKADGSTAVITVDTTNSGVSVAGNISAQNIGWRPLIAGTDFATTAASTSTITMLTNQTANIKAGNALKWKLSGTGYYGQVVSITSSLTTVRGTELTTTASALTELYYSSNQFFVPQFSSVTIAGIFADATTSTLIETKLKVKGGFEWEFPDAYLVCVKLATTEDDSGATTQPTIMIKRNGTDVMTSAMTIPDNTSMKSGIIMSASQYKFTYGDYLEVSVTAASGGTPAHNSKNLTIQFVFIRG